MLGGEPVGLAACEHCVSVLGFWCARRGGGAHTEISAGEIYGGGEGGHSPAGWLAGWEIGREDRFEKGDWLLGGEVRRLESWREGVVQLGKGEGRWWVGGNVREKDRARVRVVVQVCCGGGCELGCVGCGMEIGGDRLVIWDDSIDAEQCFCALLVGQMVTSSGPSIGLSLRGTPPGRLVKDEDDLAGTRLLRDYDTGCEFVYSCYSWCNNREVGKLMTLGWR